MKFAKYRQVLPFIFGQFILTEGYFVYLRIRQHGWPSPVLALLVYGCLSLAMILFVSKARK